MRRNQLKPSATSHQLRKIMSEKIKSHTFFHTLVSVIDPPTAIELVSIGPRASDSATTQQKKTANSLVSVVCTKFLWPYEQLHELDIYEKKPVKLLTVHWFPKNTRKTLVAHVKSICLSNTSEYVKPTHFLCL